MMRCSVSERRGASRFGARAARVDENGSLVRVVAERQIRQQGARCGAMWEAPERGGRTRTDPGRRHRRRKPTLRTRARPHRAARGAPSLSKVVRRDAWSACSYHGRGRRHLAMDEASCAEGSVRTRGGATKRVTAWLPDGISARDARPEPPALQHDDPASRALRPARSREGRRLRLRPHAVQRRARRARPGEPRLRHPRAPPARPRLRGHVRPQPDGRRRQDPRGRTGVGRRAPRALGAHGRGSSRRR